MLIIHAIISKWLRPLYRGTVLCSDQALQRLESPMALKYHLFAFTVCGTMIPRDCWVDG